MNCVSEREPFCSHFLFIYIYIRSYDLVWQICPTKAESSHYRKGKVKKIGLKFWGWQSDRMQCLHLMSCCLDWILCNKKILIELFILHLAYILFLWDNNLIYRVSSSKLIYFEYRKQIQVLLWGKLAFLIWLYVLAVLYIYIFVAKKNYMLEQMSSQTRVLTTFLLCKPEMFHHCNSILISLFGQGACIFIVNRLTISVYFSSSM